MPSTTAPWKLLDFFELSPRVLFCEYVTRKATYRPPRFHGSCPGYESCLVWGFAGTYFDMCTFPVFIFRKQPRFRKRDKLRSEWPPVGFFRSETREWRVLKINKDCRPFTRTSAEPSRDWCLWIEWRSGPASRSHSTSYRRPLRLGFFKVWATQSIKRFTRPPFWVQVVIREGETKWVWLQQRGSDEFNQHFQVSEERRGK